ncbi:MAG: flagellar biosynthesis anti-sigma factor FlgM [Selenomonadaceae bacterium]
MIVDTRVQSVASVYANNALSKQKQATSGTNRTETADAVVLSSEAQSFSQVLQRVQAMPEARMDKVAAYTDKINSGEYQVNAKELAGKILDMRF